MQEPSRQAFGDLNQLKLELQFDGFSSEVLYWGYFSGETWWRNYLHVHSFFEVCYVLQGEGSFHINGKDQALKAQDLFIARPNERHEIISSKNQPLAIYFWSYTLTTQKPRQDYDLFKLFQAFIQTSEVIIANATKLADLLEHLNREINQKQLGYRTVIENLAKQVLIETARMSVRTLPQASPLREYSHQELLVRTIDQYLRDNTKEPLRLKEIAAQIHLSERHMSRTFKAVTGKTIKSYATELKIEIAKQLLLKQKLSIADVAYETGFLDARHFSTLFRKHSGLSPSQYRERGGTEFI
ncbi:MAG: helix-turn-helix domain-containing protein [Trueperaceae bacterium]|nr:helix-turn-helix domain-containing protein [Trueperaceae bacterium]